MVNGPERPNKLNKPDKPNRPERRKGETIESYNFMDVPPSYIGDIIHFPIIYMPGILGRKLRYWYYKKRFKRCGKNVIIDEGVIIQNPEWVSVGDNVWIDKYCILMAGKVNLEGKIHKRKENKDFIGEEGELIIGSNVHIAPFCLIQAHGGVLMKNSSSISSGTKMYSLSTLPNNPYALSQKTLTSPMEERQDEVPFFISPIVIQNNSWAGLNCIILAGVTIGENSFIRSNAICYKSLPPNSYAAGDPAERIKERFKLEKINE